MFLSCFSIHSFPPSQFQNFLSDLLKNLHLQIFTLFACLFCFQQKSINLCLIEPFGSKKVTAPVRDANCFRERNKQALFPQPSRKRSKDIKKSFQLFHRLYVVEGLRN